MTNIIFILKNKIFNEKIYHVNIIDEFLEKFLNVKLLNKQYPEKYSHILKNIKNNYIGETNKKLENIFGNDITLDSIENFKGKELLKKCFLKNPFNNIGLILNFYRNYFKSKLSPNGISMSFTGPDGSGKTTILEIVENELWLKNADILVFAGDNSHYPRQNKLMLEKIAAKKIYKKIFVTFGNHDLYIISNQQKSKYKTSWDKVLELKQICEEIDTVEFLDGNIVEVEKDFSNEFNSLKDMDYEEAKKMLQGNKFKTVKDMVDFLS